MNLSDLKRYDLVEVYDCFIGEAQDGEYVKYEDVEALITKLTSAPVVTRNIVDDLPRDLLDQLEAFLRR